MTAEVTDEDVRTFDEAWRKVASVALDLDGTRADWATHVRAGLAAVLTARQTEAEHVRSNPGHIVVRNSGQPAWCSKRDCGWKENSNG